MRKEKIEVYAVIRIDEWAAQYGDHSVRVKEILPTAEQAIAEVERLNKLNRDKECHYFWQATRYFPTSQ